MKAHFTFGLTVVVSVFSLLLPVILAYTLLFSGFRTIGVAVYLCQVPWVVVWGYFLEPLLFRKA